MKHDLVILNCYDAGALESWADNAGHQAICLRSEEGRVFVRGLSFSPEPEIEEMMSRCPSRFRVRPMVTTTGSLALCTEEELAGLIDRVKEMTKPYNSSEEEVILPAVGAIVEVASLHPILPRTQGEVTRVSPKSGNVRILVAGKYWTIPCQFLSTIKEIPQCS